MKRVRGIQLHVESPAKGQRVLLGSNLRVSGWAFSTGAPIERVEAELDDTGRVLLRHGHSRPDVARSFPAEPSARDSGFAGRFRLSAVEGGERHITITATNANGETATMRRTIEIELPSELSKRAGYTTARPPAEDALVFLHIPKTAGTSVRALFESVVPADERLYVYPTPPGVPVDAFPLLPEPFRASLRLVMGHIEYGIHQWLPQPVRYLTMLREPVDRLVSLYYHHRTHPTSRHYGTIAGGGMPLDEFIENPRLAPRSQMARLIAGRRRLNDTEAAALARRNIEQSFAAVLLMEEMEESIARLQRTLGAQLRRMPPQNVNKARPRSALTPQLRSRIEQLNAVDVELYEEARIRFERERAAERRAPIGRASSRIGPARSGG